MQATRKHWICRICSVADEGPQDKTQVDTYRTDPAALDPTGWQRSMGSDSGGGRDASRDGRESPYSFSPLALPHRERHRFSRSREDRTKGCFGPTRAAPTMTKGMPGVR